MPFFTYEDKDSKHQGCWQRKNIFVTICKRLLSTNGLFGGKGTFHQCEGGGESRRVRPYSHPPKRTLFWRLRFAGFNTKRLVFLTHTSLLPFSLLSYVSNCKWKVRTNLQLCVRSWHTKESWSVLWDMLQAYLLVSFQVNELAGSAFYACICFSVQLHGIFSFVMKHLYTLYLFYW